MTNKDSSAIDALLDNALKEIISEESEKKLPDSSISPISEAKCGNQAELPFDLVSEMENMLRELDMAPKETTDSSISNDATLKKQKSFKDAVEVTQERMKKSGERIQSEINTPTEKDLLDEMLIF